MRITGLISDARDLYRTYRLAGVARRGAHEIRRRTGSYRRLVSRPAPQTQRVPLRFDLDPLRRFYKDHPEIVTRLADTASRLMSGSMPFFAGPWIDTGWPPRWHRHPRTGAEWPSDAHWTSLSTTDPERGDIKWIWEPSRLSFAFLLARAFVATEDRRHVEAFWELLHGWMRSNPPYLGANWYCGQETALRTIAIDFAVGVFEAAGERLSDDQQRVIGQLAYDSAQRIELAVNYALAQRNNHALSELTGLWALATAHPGWPESSRWRTFAERGLARCIREQFAPDGSYIQESFHYHRLAIHLLAWLAAVARLRQQAPPPEVYAALERSHAFLAAFVDIESGWSPNYGPNDGALLLALSHSEYPDFRPTLRHVAATIRQAAVVSEGPWDEAALWLEGRVPAVTAAPTSRTRTETGYLSSRLGSSLVCSRAPEHRTHRPGHADALHVDLFVAGRNVALDPGTYAYTAPPPWDNSLARTRVHNTCSVGNRDQMRRRGRFLWTRWTRARISEERPVGAGVLWDMEAYADWEHTCRHRRVVVHVPGRLWVFDRLTGWAGEPMRLHWNLDGVDWKGDPGRLVWTSRGIVVGIRAAPDPIDTTYVGDEHSALGWVARTYGDKRPCTALEITVRRTECATFATCFSWDGTSPDMDVAWRAWSRGDLAIALSQLDLD